MVITRVGNFTFYIDNSLLLALGNLYDVTHGSRVLSMAPGLQDLEIIPFRVAAYDSRAEKMAFFEEKRSQDFIFISGTKMRSKLYVFYYTLY